MRSNVEKFDKEEEILMNKPKEYRKAALFFKLAKNPILLNAF